MGIREASVAVRFAPGITGYTATRVLAQLCEDKVESKETTSGSNSTLFVINCRVIMTLHQLMEERLRTVFLSYRRFLEDK